MFPVNYVEVLDSDVESVVSALRETWLSGETPIVEEFENSFAEYAGTSHAIAVSNGSTALELAFAALNLSPGDEVILPSFAIISCLAPILRMKLTPVFTDSSLLTWNANPDEVLSKITERTRAILIVHTYGLAIDVTQIREVCNEKNIFLIEDCAEAHGLEINQKKCGQLADISTYSFYSNKLVTTGEGGMCTTSNGKIAQKLRKLRNLAFEPERRFFHEELGYNFRLSGLQAALGCSQLKRASKNLTHKRNIAYRYQANLDSNKGFTWQPREYSGCVNGYWIVGVLLTTAGITAAEVQAELHKNGVMTRPFFYPLHKQPVLKRYFPEKTFHAANAETLGLQGFYLPSGNAMPFEDVDQISEITLKVFSQLKVGE